MSEQLKAANIKKAIALLPMPKTYPPQVITVAVGKLKYTFEKFEDEWCLKF